MNYGKMFSWFQVDFYNTHGHETVATYQENKRARNFSSRALIDNPDEVMEK